MKSQNRLKGIIPAAGKGTRMLPLTNTLPKALIEINGRTLLERSIDSLKTIGIEKFIVMTGHLEEKIKDLLQRKYFGVQIKTVSQKEQLGLEHAISLASNEIEEDFVVLCPDNIYTDTNDLQKGKEIFFKYKPTVLQIATVIPSQQSNRSIYFSDSLRNIEPNIFDNTSRQVSTSGIPMFSAGLTFFSKEAIKYLSTFEDIKTESKFSSYLSKLMEKAHFMIYLLRGARYDFSALQDIDSYNQLQRTLTNTEGKGISAILLNKEREVLLQLRDNIPTIRYPNHWGLFGGTIDPGETVYKAVEREIREELGYCLTQYGLFREFVQNNKREYAFMGEVKADLSELKLNEGRKKQFFRLEEIEGLKIRPDDKETLRTYKKLLGQNG